jgi:voltage-gated potassium channel
VPELPDTPTRFVDLTSAERRWAVTKGIIFNVVVWVVLFGLYLLTPARAVSGFYDIGRIVLVVLFVGGVIGWQAWRISNGPIPELRAVEALGTILPVFLLAFAVIYLSTASTHTHAFSEPLNHVAAAYFAITVFSTVGFGDITPVSDSMRIAVSVQMLLDLVFIGVVVRLLFSRARSILSGTSESGESA